jgi:hypothetical protein
MEIAMKMLVTAALIGGLGLAVPATGMSQELMPEGADIRIVPVSVVGGVVDGLRADAFAGTDVQEVQWIGQNDPLLDRALDRRNVDISEVDAIYTDLNGTYWVFVDLADDDDQQDETPA